jgi:serine/threonine protein kinase/Tol biopolymer transport system component
MIGRTLGNFRIVEQAGMGGMATVYKAYDASTDRYVAIKTLPQQYSKDPNFRARFEIEARAIARLEHIHILPIFAYGEEDGIVYMAMRYMDTGTLTDLIRQARPDLQETSRLLKQIAGAVDYAHDNGVLHRDIKPSNILVDSQRNAFLTDFGIAKIVEGTLDLTGTGILGTPQYMSPEQCRGEKDLPPASDQYALGVVLYEMVTGRTPYQAETPLAVIQKQILGEPLPPPSSLRPDLPDDVEKVILKALAREPQERFPACLKMAEAFEKAIQGYTPPELTETPTADALKMPPIPETGMDGDGHDTQKSDATHSDTRKGAGYASTAVGLQDGVENLPDTKTELSDAPLPSKGTVQANGAPPKRRTGLWIGLMLLLLVIVGGSALWIGISVSNQPTPTPDAVALADTDAPTQAPTDIPTQAPTDVPTQAPVELPTATLDAFGAARATNDAEQQINAARTAIFFENQTATAMWWTDTPAPTSTPSLTSTPEPSNTPRPTRTPTPEPVQVAMASLIERDVTADMMMGEPSLTQPFDGDNLPGHIDFFIVGNDQLNNVEEHWRIVDVQDATRRVLQGIWGTDGQLEMAIPTANSYRWALSFDMRTYSNSARFPRFFIENNLGARCELYIDNNQITNDTINSSFVGESCGTTQEDRFLPLSLPRGQWIPMSLVRVDDYLALYAEGELVFDIELDANWATDVVRIALFDARVWFDNLEMRPLLPAELDEGRIADLEGIQEERADWFESSANGSYVRIGALLSFEDATTGETMIPDIGRTQWNRIQGASWSPDGQRLAFAETEIAGDGNNNGFSVINADGSAERQIVLDDQNINWLAWSPAGDVLIAQGDCVTFLLTPEGEVYNEYENTCGVSGWSWSPDGRYAVARREGIKPYALVRLEPATGELLVLRGIQERYGAQAYSPDGQYIVYSAGEQNFIISAEGRTDETSELRVPAFPSWWTGVYSAVWDGRAETEAVTYLDYVAQVRASAGDERRADARATADAIIANNAGTQDNLPVLTLLDGLPVAVGDTIFAQDFAEESDLETIERVAFEQRFDDSGRFAGLAELPNPQDYWIWLPEEGGIVEGQATAIDPIRGDAMLYLPLPSIKNFAFTARYRLFSNDVDGVGYLGIYLSQESNQGFCQWDLRLTSAQSTGEQFYVLQCDGQPILQADIPSSMRFDDGAWHTIEGAYNNGAIIVTIDGELVAEMPDMDTYGFAPTGLTLSGQHANVQWDDITVYELVPTEANASTDNIQARLDAWIANPPDYERIVRCFHHEMGDGICLMDAESGVSRFGALDFVREHPALNRDNFGMGAWSPDGQRVMLNGNLERARLFEVDLEAQLLEPRVDDGNDNAWVDWVAHPDGERVAYAENGALALMFEPFSPESEPEILARPPDSECFFKPQWSPDGERLVMYRGTCMYGASRYDVVVWQPDGMITLVDDIRFNNRCHHEWLSAFSPDGRVVAYHNDDCETVFADSETGDIYRVEPQDAFPHWWMGSAFPRWGHDVRVGVADMQARIAEWVENPPDYQRLIRCEHFGFRDAEICTITQDGDVTVSGWDFISETGLRAGPMSWSPDGDAHVVLDA